MIEENFFIRPEERDFYRNASAMMAVATLNPAWWPLQL